MHVAAAPYSYSIQTCNNVECYGELRIPAENGLCDVVMHRQPTPQAYITDTKGKGHFLTRTQSLVESANNPGSLVDFPALLLSSVIIQG